MCICARQDFAELWETGSRPGPTEEGTREDFGVCRVQHQVATPPMSGELGGVSLADEGLPMVEAWSEWVARLRNTTQGEP